MTDSSFLADLHLLQNFTTFRSQSFPDHEEDDLIDIELKDPALIAKDVEAQIQFIPKLKFQYIEQNAKDNYVQSIVKDIDDAPIVTTDNNTANAQENARSKAALKEAKVKLSQKYQEIRELAPAVEREYHKTKETQARSIVLTQKITDARLAINRLRQSHPQPRLTVPAAEKMLQDQVDEMQALDERKEAMNKKVQALKHEIKAGERENEVLRVERAELEKAVKAAGIAQEDPRIAQRYDWYESALTLHRSLVRLDSLQAQSENELRLSYELPQERNAAGRPTIMTITLIFVPNTRHLHEVQISGVDDLGIDMGDAIDAHIQVNDAQGVIAAILARVYSMTMRE